MAGVGVFEKKKERCTVRDIEVDGSRPSSSSSSSVDTLCDTNHVPGPFDDEKKASDGPSDLDLNIPDGGWLAWSQVIAANLSNAVSWGYAATWGIYQLYYVDALGLSSADVSWIGSIQVFIGFLVCAPSGRLADAGYPREVIIVGSFFVVLGSYMTSFCSQYWQIMLAQGVCLGIGIGVGSTPAVAITSSYFKKNRPMALSVSGIGTSLGGVIFPATVQYLIPQIGFRWASRVAALIALVICITSCLLLRPRLPGRKTGPLIEWAAFREIPYVLFAIGSFLNFYGMYFGLFYINSFARNIIGFSSLESVNLLLVTNAVGIVVRPIAGQLANRHLGSINVYILATGLIGSMLFIWTAVHSRASMYAFSVFYGLATSASQATYVPSLASLTTDPQKMGIRFGMIETLCAFSTLAGPPTAGFIIDQSGGRYLGAQIWGGSVMLAAATFLAATRISVTGWKWKVLL
ncbi:hypothetical protein E4U42_002548 [Claviceps africana]|uniref:Major facilitator superfamily (MFS) profile domain-containing protein n=1 Tax=Claviceps africana TaxID=83212 RepID=A0A8K0J845_9HYPO|nr:hypothetical protein E4U42_002548 [Claviceps africana]